jgi:hypothetical protein
MLKYHDRVWIQEGFYKGQYGIVVDYYRIGVGYLEDVRYDVEIDVIGGRPCTRKVIVECDEYELELI